MKMKPTKSRLIGSGILLIVLCLLTAAVPLRAETEKDLYDRSRLAWFDRDWDRTLELLDTLIKKYPESKYYAQVLYFKGKCWEEKKNEPKALEYYKAFVKISGNESLKEEAYVAIIDIYYRLYKKGDEKYGREILRHLEDPRSAVRFYAAFKLSYAENKSIAKKAVPILQEIIDADDDEDLVDRAKIALMRIGPENLNKKRYSKTVDSSSLFIRIVNPKSGKEEFSITIPFSLAKLALGALPGKDKEELVKQGIDLDKLIKSVIDTGELFSLKSEDSIIEIGIK